MDTPPTVKPRALRRWLSYGEVVVPFAAGILLALGYVAWSLYWFVLFVVTATNLTIVFRMNETLLRMNETLLREGERLLWAVGTIEAMPVVVCAGCHRRLSAVYPAGIPLPDVVPLPDGWELRHERPYCPDCLAKES
jgi:hypothetical protein